MTSPIDLYYLALLEAANVGVAHGIDEEQAHRFVSKLMRGGPILPRLSLLDQAGAVLFFVPQIMAKHLNGTEVDNSASALVHELGHALMAIDEPTVVGCLLERHRCHTFGAATPLGKQRTAVAGGPAQLAFILCKAFPELRSLDALDFIYLMRDSGATGRGFQSPTDFQIAEGMDPKDRQQAELRGFSLGWDMAATNPAVTEWPGERLYLDRNDIFELAYEGRTSGFKQAHMEAA